MKSLTIFCFLSVLVSLVTGEELQDDYKLTIFGPSLQNLTMVCTNNEQCNAQFKDSLCSSGKCYCRKSENSDTVPFLCTLDNAINITTKNFGVIGRKCKDDADCGFENSHCNKTHQCYCNSGFTEDTGKHKCLIVVKNINGSCKDNMQCLASFHHSTCKDNQCTCENGFYFDQTLNQCALSSDADSIFSMSATTIILLVSSLLICFQ
ncbi:GSCOCG00012031001-RA-CDS [Cotesia congregata]|uniref:Uncharacterized protein n=1 Tax=Cotesia congregata TaxID=51543 RepID=A0A8J2MM56_COTCN|nr:GSCOCG00012031001-RA-CDS [Cotesia congregata]CAG5093144.1 Protein of unknown function [Cotesia congregata]